MRISVDVTSASTNTFDLKNRWKILRCASTQTLQNDWEKLAADPANLMTRADFVRAMADQTPSSWGLTPRSSAFRRRRRIYIPELDRALKVVGVLAPTG